MASQKDSEAPTAKVEMKWAGIMTDPPAGVKPPTIEEPWINARDYTTKAESQEHPPHTSTNDGRRM